MTDHQNQEQLTETMEEQLEQAARLRQQRIEKFSLDIDFSEDLPPIAEPSQPISRAEADTMILPDSAELSAPRQRRATKHVKKAKKKGKHRFAWGAVGTLFYLLGILVVSGLLSAVILVGALDLTGLNRSQTEVQVTIPEGATAAQVADILHQAGVIDQPMLFRLYVSFTNSGASLQSGTFTVAPAYGYSGIIEVLQQEVARATVRVTIPEGFTVEKIGALLEERKVCSALDFYKAVNSREYDYSFIEEIPENSNRIYLLEGYLFPDTYEFYADSKAEIVVDKMLSNFNNKVTTKMRAAIRQKGYTLDQAVILSSIIQSEVGMKEDMLKVARVLLNRLENPSVYPKLQCNTTTYYIKRQHSYEGGVPIVVSAYDTYQCVGLPAGAISNPGLLALESFISPSANSAVKACYYFATDTTTGITYYSRTLAEHNAICKKYGIAESL